MGNDFKDTFNLAVITYLLRDLTLLPLALAFSAFAAMGLLGATSKKHAPKLTDEHDRAMMADDGSGSAFARQRARSAHHRYHALSSDATALPPARG